MSFLNPGFAPWLLAIAVPILIHLLTRQAARVMPLPTLRFLQRAAARQSKLFRIRHLVLLALRCLVVALIVAIFLKPVRLAPLARSSGAARRVVIALDVSLSMGYRRGGASSLQKGRAAAERVLSGLRQGDLASVILAGASPIPALPRPSSDTASLRSALRNAAATQEKCDVNAALTLAADQLGGGATGRRELYLVSDFQRTNWADARLDALPPDTSVVFVATEEAERENVAVTGIRLRPAAPRAGDDVTALVEVWNGTGSPRPIPVSFRAGDTPERKEIVTVPPYSSASASFPVAFPSPGRYVCRAGVPEDGLAADNVRWKVADLEHSLNVLLLTDEDSTRSPSGSFFVSRALNPTPGRPGGIRVLPKRAVEATDADLRAADVVTLCNVTTMDAGRLPALVKYVRGGGALVVFLYGPRVTAQMEAMNRIAGSGEGLPFVPTASMDVRGHGKGYVTLSEARYESRLLRLFKDPSAADLSRIRFHRFFLTTEVDGRAETLLKFDDGTPAAARRLLGAGSVLMLNLSPSPGDSDLIKQEVFPPLLHELLKGLVTREGEHREFSPGGSASATIEPTREPVTVTGPDGRTMKATIDKESGGVALDQVRRAGIYTLSTRSGRQAGLMAVNADPAESDLRTIDPRELRARQDRRHVYLAGSGGGAASLDDLSRSRPLWPYLVFALLFVLALEQVFSVWTQRGQGE